MCAEVLWWRCHRRIVADYLTRRETVWHILESGTSILPCSPLQPDRVHWRWFYGDQDAR
jgi:hypothetical protein